MKILIHDLPEMENVIKNKKYDESIYADGRYAPCRGCFHCWTKHPAACEMKDSLHEVCRKIGLADDLVIITENWYGGYSPAVKNLLDRAIGVSTPFSTYRGGQMHHTLRYGKRNLFKVIAYGDFNENEEKTWKLMAERNAVNYGYRSSEFVRVSSIDDLEAMDI